MKTRFKIVIVIVCFVVFYVALIPIWQACNGSGIDCTIWQELINLTRPVVPSEWMGEQVGWKGSTDDIEYHLLRP